ncbi:hypothetical protein ACSVH2_12600 [Flavobacterium sp. RSB2_4_14]|uniref:hypothetical protein n=1 Tax=Flavobacterium sp. RSB2_4_14 TaxID=3447665 RepID=UPI003F3FEE9C
MSFFKGIGKMIKKNVNFHTLVKVAGQGLSMVPGVGGVAGGVIQNLQEAHDAKKQANEEQAQQAIQEAANQAGTAGGTIAGQFITKTMTKAYDSAGAEIKTGLGKVGAEVANSTIKEWFKKHWKAVVGGVVGLVVVIVGAVKIFGHKSHRKPSYRR